MPIKPLALFAAVAVTFITGISFHQSSTYAETAPVQNDRGALYSANFEGSDASPDGWTPTDGATVATEGAHGGSRFLRISNLTIPAASWSSPKFDVSGPAVLVGAWLKVEDQYYSDPAYEARLTIRFYTGDHPLSQTTALGSEMVRKTMPSVLEYQMNHDKRVRFGWQHVLQAVTVPAGATSADLVFAFNMASGSAGLDDVTVSKASETTTYFAEGRQSIPERLGDPIYLNLGPGQAKLPWLEVELRDPKNRLGALNDPSDGPIFEPQEPLSFWIKTPDGIAAGASCHVHWRLIDWEESVLAQGDEPVDPANPWTNLLLPSDKVPYGRDVTLEATLYNGDTPISGRNLSFGVLSQPKLTPAELKANQFGLLGTLHGTSHERNKWMVQHAGGFFTRVIYRAQVDDYWNDRNGDINWSAWSNDTNLRTAASDGYDVVGTIDGYPHWMQRPDTTTWGRGVQPDPTEFGDMVRRIAAHYKGICNTWSIFSERLTTTQDMWNGYKGLVHSAADGVHAGNPGGVVGWEPGWYYPLPAAVAHGIYDKADYVDQHCYGPAESSIYGNAIYDLAKSLGKPVVNSEFGYMAGSGSRSITEEEHARGIVQNIAAFIALGGGKFFYYQMGGDTLTDPTIPGLIPYSAQMVSALETQPRLPYFAFRQAFDKISGAKGLGTSVVADARINDFSRDDGHIYTIWSRGEYSELGLSSSSPITVTDMQRRSWRIAGHSALGVDNWPIYLESATPIAFSDDSGKVEFTSPSNFHLPVSVTTTVAISPVKKGEPITLIIPSNVWKYSRAGDHYVVTAPDFKKDPSCPVGAIATFGQSGHLDGVAFRHFQVAPILTLSMRGIPGNTPGANAKLEVSLTNGSAETHSGLLDVIAPAVVDGQLPTFEKPISVAPFSTQKAVFDLPTDMAAQTATDEEQLAYATFADSATGIKLERAFPTDFYPIYQAPKSGLMNGDATSWDSIPGYYMGKDGQYVHGTWGGPTDLSANFHIAYDANNLYFTANITDPHAQLGHKGPDEMWMESSVQLGLRPAGFTGRQQQLTIGRSLTGDAVYRNWGPDDLTSGIVAGAHAVVKVTSGGWMCTVSIPRTAVDPTSKTWGPGYGLDFAAAINNANELGRKGWLQWYGGVADSPNPERFARMVFSGNGVKK